MRSRFPAYVAMVAAGGGDCLSMGSGYPIYCQWGMCLVDILDFGKRFSFSRYQKAGHPF
jgi:hypothetical protein